MSTELLARFRDLVETGLPTHVYPGMYNLATVVDEQEEEKHELACEEYRRELEHLAEQAAAAVGRTGLDSQPIYELVEEILEGANNDDLASLKRTVFALLRRVPSRTRGADLCAQLQLLAAGEDNPRDCQRRLRHAGTIVLRIVELLPRGAPYDEMRYRLETTEELQPNLQPLIQYVVEAIVWGKENYPDQAWFVEREYNDSDYLDELKSGGDPEFLRINLPELASFFNKRLSSNKPSTSTPPGTDNTRRALHSEEEVRDAERQVCLIFDDLDPCPHDEKHRKLLTIDELIISLGRNGIRKGLARSAITRMIRSGELRSTKRLKPMPGLLPPDYRRNCEEVDAIEFVPSSGQTEASKLIASKHRSASDKKVKPSSRSYRSQDELLAMVLTEARKPDRPGNKEIAKRLGIDNTRLSQEPFKSELAKVRDTMAKLGVAAAKGYFDENSGQILAVDPDAHEFVDRIDRHLDGDDC